MPQPPAEASTTCLQEQLAQPADAGLFDLFHSSEELAPEVSPTFTKKLVVEPAIG